MSAISSIGGSGLTQYLASIAKNKTKQAAQKASSSPSIGTSGSITSGKQALFTQVQQTVTSALQQAKASGSTKDPNQIVEDSIAQVLKNFLTGKSNPAAGSPTSAPETQEAFQSALKSAGISSQQFKTDYEAAVDDVQNGSTNPAKGSIIDVTG
jgi:hypothetical protein